MKREDRDPDNLCRPEGNDLQSNYELHDVGEVWFKKQMGLRGYAVEDWGIDMRDEDEDLIYDDKMDFKVFDTDGNLVAIVDAKTKQNPRWLGIYNERHHEHYCEIDAAHDCTVLVAMFLLSEEQVEQTFLIDIADASTARFIDRKFRAPDGNMVVVVDEKFHRSWDSFESLVL